MRLDRGLDVMLQRPIFRIGNISDTQQSFHLHPALIGDCNVAVFFIDDEIAGVLRRFARSAFDFLALLQFRDDAIDLVVLVGGFLAGAGNDQRGSGFVDQDRVDFVDDGKIVSALHTFANVELHVVAQVVETEFVVGAVGNVGGVSGTALFVI